jgi:hypothetical protein
LKNQARRVATPRRRASRVYRIAVLTLRHYGVNIGKGLVYFGPQSLNRDDDHRSDQRHHQAVFHRGRTRLIFEKILDPLHLPLSFFVDFVFPFGFGSPRLTSFLTFATGIHARFLWLITSWLLTSIFLNRFLGLLDVIAICLK